MPYNSLTFTAATQLLASRLQDPGFVFWNQPNELLNCIIEAVRFNQLLTASYKQKLAFSTVANVNYYNLAALPSSPLAPAVTDVEIANNVLAALLEPPLPLTGVWFGTGQFTLSQITTAIQNRMNRFIGETGRHTTQRTIGGPSPPVDLADLPNDTLDVRRAGWMPVARSAVATGSLVGGRLVATSITDTGTGYLTPPTVTFNITGGGAVAPTGYAVLQNGGVLQIVILTQGSGIATVSISFDAPTGVTFPLGRMDEWAEQSYVPGATQNPTQPFSYSVFGVPPVQIRMIPPPDDVGDIDLILVTAGPTLNFDVSNPVTIPISNELTAALKWGALADIIGSDGPSRDYARAAYCEQRYNEYVQLARIYPSVLTADINNVSCGIGSVFDMDSYLPDWQQTAGVPSFVGMCGRQLACVGQTPDDGTAGGNPDGGYGVGLWVCASVPTSPIGYIQAGQDQLDPIIDYAQHIASFKMGGAEFDGTERLFSNLIASAKSQNSRLSAVGFYRSAQQQAAMKDTMEVPRILV